MTSLDSLAPLSSVCALSLLEHQLVRICFLFPPPFTGQKKLQRVSTGRTDSTAQRPERFCLVLLKANFSLHQHDIHTSTTTSILLISSGLL